MAHTGHQGDQVERRVCQHMLALGNPASGQGRGCGDTVTRAVEQFLAGLGVVASSTPVWRRDEHGQVPPRLLGVLFCSALSSTAEGGHVNPLSSRIRDLGNGAT